MLETSSRTKDQSHKSAFPLHPHHEGQGNKLERVVVHKRNTDPGAFGGNSVLSTGDRQECNLLTRKGIKVFPFYFHDAAKDIFDEIASITGGKVQTIDAKDEESIVDTVCATALEDIDGATMQETIW